MKIKKTIGTIVLTTAISLTAFATDSEASSAYSGFERISGESRYDTAVQVSQQGWASNSTNYVVLAVGNNYPDALSGVPLAKKLNAPILLVRSDAVPSSVISEIKRIGAENAVVLGGTGVISNAVLDQLKKAGITPERIAGKNRHETSALIAEKVGGTSAVVTSSANFADSLAIASYAAEKGMPVLLTSPKAMTPEVEAKVKEYSTVTVIGGELAVSDSVYDKIDQTASVRRISGKDRYETAAKVVSGLYPDTVSTSLIASGETFADALTGSAYGAKIKKPVLLVRQKSLPAATESVIEAKNVSSLVVVGGAGAVADSALQPASSSVDKRSEIVAEAKKYLGVPYLYGGKTPSGFDCSGFLQYVFAQEGISTPRTTSQLTTAGKAVSVSNMKPGDIIVFDLNNSRPTSASHAGIYIGDGRIIHANSRTGISNQPLSWLGWNDNILTVRSFVN